jgi:hypothetical protein
MTNDPIGDAKAGAARGDFESAIALLRPLAEAGNREAQYELGFLALTECDLIPGREAFSLFMKAAEQGHADAMYHLATFPQFLSEPFRSPLSEEEGWSWLLRSAESGCVQAQYDAAASLATGDWGSVLAAGTSKPPSRGTDAQRRPAMPRPSTTSRRCSRRVRGANGIWLRRGSG